VNFLSLIEAKREGKTLAPAEIQKFVGEICRTKTIAEIHFSVMLE
jgi:thymidine phosphorylase